MRGDIVGVDQTTGSADEQKGRGEGDGHRCDRLPRKTFEKVV